MKARTKKLGTRAVAMLLSAVTAFSLFPVSAGAAQVNSYHDPAEHWMQASGRTNELDCNAVVTHETFNCGVCGKATSFQVFRTPEYTRDGQTAMNRNVKYSDGTMVGGSGTGTILDGVPGQNASYTGYHWTKAVCETCGTVNSSNMRINDYGFGKNVYWLYDCDSKFMQELPEQKTYEYVDSTYHKVTTTGGEYCAFCYGTNHTKSSVLERHDMGERNPFSACQWPICHRREVQGLRLRKIRVCGREVRCCQLLRCCGRSTAHHQRDRPF